MVLDMTRLTKNTEAIVSDLNVTDAVKQRFYELGIIPGTKVSLVNKSLFGGPITFNCRGSKIVLRTQTAKNILVQTD